MAKKPRNSRLSWLFALAVFFFILTFSIALPIYIRPFYYVRIPDLAQTSGFTAGQIRAAYDQLLNYLTLPGFSFGTGELLCSADAQAHFADCKALFDLNAAVLLISCAIILVMAVLRRKGRLASLGIGSRSAAFWAAVSAVLLPVVLGALAATDFDRAFVIFHSIFFPGKTNWRFNWHTDQIIRVLPQSFFMHCAILIGAGVLLLSGGILLWELLRSKRKAPSPI